MRELLENWKIVLKTMFSPPWKRLALGGDDEGQPHYFPKIPQWFLWIYGWLLSMAGIVAIGIFLPYFVLAWGVPADYQIYVLAVVVFLGAVIGQFSYLLGMFVVLRLARPLWPKSFTSNSSTRKSLVLFISVVFPMSIFWLLFPFGAAGFAVHWYFSNFAPLHNLIGASILGAFSLKLLLTAILPLIPPFLGSHLLTRLRHWIFDEPKLPKSKAKAPPPDTVLP